MKRTYAALVPARSRRGRKKDIRDARERQGCKARARDGSAGCRLRRQNGPTVPESSPQAGVLEREAAARDMGTEGAKAFLSRRQPRP